VEGAGALLPAASASDPLAQARLIAAQTTAAIHARAGLEAPAAGAAPSGLAALPVPPPFAPPFSVSMPAPAPPSVLSREIEINNCRNKATLTRKATHEQIREETGTVVMIRGRYKPPGDTSTDERPLHLLLQASSEAELEKAEERIRELMGPVLTPQPDAATGAAASASGHESAARGGLLECKVPVEVDPVHAGNVRGKVLGPRGSYIRHIEAEAGVRVQVTGGHGGMASLLDGPAGAAQMEPLFIEITAPTEAQLQLARGLAESLVRSVKQRLAQPGPAGCTPPHPGAAGMYGGAPMPPLLPQAGLPPPPPAPPGFAPPPGVHAHAPPPPPPPPVSSAYPSARGYPPPSFPPPYAPPSSYPPTSSPYAPPACYGSHAPAYGGPSGGGGDYHHGGNCAAPHASSYQYANDAFANGHAPPYNHAPAYSAPYAPPQQTPPHGYPGYGGTPPPPLSAGAGGHQGAMHPGYQYPGY
jgi:hypothetical protein